MVLVNREEELFHLIKDEPKTKYGNKGAVCCASDDM